MIGVLFSSTLSTAGERVLAAVRRSVGHDQAKAISRYALWSSSLSIILAISPPESWGKDLIDWIDSGHRKLVIFGALPQALATRFGCRATAWPEALKSASRSPSASSGMSSQSDAVVRYSRLSEMLGGSAWHRPFERFDFTDEWNNLGYGAIRADDSDWAVSQPVDAPEAARLASVYVDEDRHFSYAGLWDIGSTSVLWFNRAMGSCDSFEWRLVENFLSGYRAQELSCQPVFSEIPWGYDAAITSRLDCDEDIESARALWNAYQGLGVPFTLAVHTSNLADSRNHSILRELIEADGAVLSHTATHAPDWGGTYEAALAEGGESARLIEKITNKKVRYAVSPFHQSPGYALEALADVGYAGCVGGIIRNDPEFLLARAGTLAGMPVGFIGHSQQCMLHGECMLIEGDPLQVFKQAFDLAFETRALFGYLDHPFSTRYQYGWSTEESRIAAHKGLIEYILQRAEAPIFLHEEAALDFLYCKSQVSVSNEGVEFVMHRPDREGTDLSLAVEYRNERFEMVQGMRLK
jgi:hypothetical protein